MVAFSGGTGSGGSGAAGVPTNPLPQPAVTAGTARQPITSGTVECFAVSIKSALANTGNIWLGDSTVTNGGGGNVATELLPGEGVSFDVGSTAGLYVVSNVAAQKVYVGVVA